MKHEAVLVGDVGGTHSRWAIFDGELGPIDVSKTSTARSLVEAARPYSGRYRAAGVAVAGPVEQGKVVLTNADWRGSVSDLDVPVRLVNDLEAVAFSIPLLTARDIQWWGGRGESLERVLCLGIGTGFGGALFTPDDVIAMEPGHEPLHGGFGDQTVESVVSGLSLARHRDHALFRAALAFAVDRLVERWAPDALCLIGGVVEHHSVLFDDLRPKVESYGRIVHPCPALLGAARAAITAL